MSIRLRQFDVRFLEKFACAVCVLCVHIYESCRVLCARVCMCVRVFVCVCTHVCVLACGWWAGVGHID